MVTPYLPLSGQEEGDRGHTIILLPASSLIWEVMATFTPSKSLHPFSQINEDAVEMMMVWPWSPSSCSDQGR
jgi:hypothetical protein